MKKFQIFLCILCVFSLIISCVSINAVKIVKGEKGEKGEDGINGINGQNGNTPYIKDGYWWIGDTNTGYLVEHIPCYVEVVTKNQPFSFYGGEKERSATIREIRKFCINNIAQYVEITYNKNTFGDWLLPSLIPIGTDHTAYYSYYENNNYHREEVTYHEITVSNLVSSKLPNITMPSNSQVTVKYTIEEFLRLNYYIGVNAYSATVIYTENQHIIQKGE